MSIDTENYFKKENVIPTGCKILVSHVRVRGVPGKRGEAKKKGVHDKKKKKSMHDTIHLCVCVCVYPIHTIKNF